MKPQWTAILATLSAIALAACGEPGTATREVASPSAASYDVGLASLTFRYPASFTLDPKSFQGEAKWWGRVIAPDGVLAVEAMSHGYCSERLHEVEGFKSPEDYVLREVCGPNPARTKFDGYDRLVSRDATTVTVVFLSQEHGWGRRYQLLTFHFRPGGYASVAKTIEEIIGTALPSFDAKRWN
ncbi:hypothetical protein AYO49_03595 [Verrucomicrobiaceae bacterium SCGC AG-212-N21]|nr:hypothetical protein AYO49_03595 [Verrucomicrobiaceae bacterium SCGC AG-212-N21]